MVPAPRPLRTLHRLREAGRIRLWAWTRPRLAELAYVNGGLGDELMLTAVARAARAAGRPLHVLTDVREIWHGNRDPLSVQFGVEDWFYARRRGWIRTNLRHLSYQTGAPGHLAEQMARHYQLTLPTGWRPLFPTLAAHPRDPRLIVVQNSCRGARYAAPTKEWAPERWQELARRLQPRWRLVQVGTPSDPPLLGAEDLRGRTTLGEVARWLAQARLFIGLESGLQHLAAAVQTPSVIIFGGRSLPAQTGYPFNVNIVRHPPCSPCALNSGCPHDLACLDIPVDEVAAHVAAALERNPNS